MSRDLIDLAMLCESGALPQAALDKARHAYGDSVLTDLVKAQQGLLDSEGRLKVCMRALGMTMAPAELRARVQRLRAPVVKAVGKPAGEAATKSTTKPATKPARRR